MSKRIRTALSCILAIIYLGVTVWIYRGSGLSNGNAVLADIALTLVVLGLFIYGAIQE